MSLEFLNLNIENLKLDGGLIMKNQEGILIIEDDDVIVKNLSKLFRMDGYEVLSASSGEAGIQTMIKNKGIIHLILLDLRLNGIDGFEVLQFARHYPDPPFVIIMTGFPSYENLTNAMKYKVFDFISKPIDYDYLVSRASQAIKIYKEVKRIMEQGNVLIVDDDEFTLPILKEALEKENFNVFTALNGQEALKIYDNNGIDVCIVDIRMPVMNGLTLMKEIRERGEAVEMIIMSGHGDMDEALESLKLGCHSFFKKPIELDELIETIKISMYDLNIKVGMRKRIKEINRTKIKELGRYL